MRFAAYGIGQDVNDPVVHAIHQLLDHAAASEERFNRLLALLQRGGVDCAEAKAIADAFDPQQIKNWIETDVTPGDRDR
jgi:serine O-acetyltransferase